MKINMTAVLGAQDIAAAVAKYVSAETNRKVSAGDVAIPGDAVATVTIGEGPVTPVSQGNTADTKAEPGKDLSGQAPEPEKKPAKKAAVKTKAAPKEDSKPETSPESDTPAEAAAETKTEATETEADAEPKSARKGSIFNFEKK